MKFLCFLTVMVGVAAVVNASPKKIPTTAQRIASLNYPVEEHEVQTGDGYILKLFRIPYSPKLKNADDKNKPIAFLQHGILSSSDCFILNGPENALAYLLVDAGYDVWLGNVRGNTYSKKHVSKSPLLPSFWDFSWNEIAIYDLPAMIDYVLNVRNSSKLHYIGHSQGTTIFLVMLSTLPRYNDKIKTSHMLSPVFYMDHLASPLAPILGPLFGHPKPLADLIGGAEFTPHNKLIAMLGSEACSIEVVFQPICANIIFLIAGYDSKHLNYSLLPDVAETHPAGASTLQVVHYLQEYQSGYFREFDHGIVGNKKHYKQNTPPDYRVENVRLETPINFFYADNDYLSSVIDVKRMAERLGKNVKLHHVQYEKWNHLDFLWALEVKSELYDKIIASADNYEKNKKSA